jgi:hypothetical protein
MGFAPIRRSPLQGVAAMLRQPTRTSVTVSHPGRIIKGRPVFLAGRLCDAFSW